jgi:hypothetical protein
MCKLALRPAHSHLHWVPVVLSLGVKRLEREADHSYPTSCLDGVHRDYYTFTLLLIKIAAYYVFLDTTLFQGSFKTQSTYISMQLWTRHQLHAPAALLREKETWTPISLDSKLDTGPVYTLLRRGNSFCPCLVSKFTRFFSNLGTTTTTDIQTSIHQYSYKVKFMPLEAWTGP